MPPTELDGWMVEHRRFTGAPLDSKRRCFITNVNLANCSRLMNSKQKLSCRLLKKLQLWWLHYSILWLERNSGISLEADAVINYNHPKLWSYRPSCYQVDPLDPWKSPLEIPHPPTLLLLPFDVQTRMGQWALSQCDFQIYQSGPFINNLDHFKLFIDGMV